MFRDTPLWDGDRLEIAIIVSIILMGILALTLYIYGRVKPEFREKYWANDKRLAISFIWGYFMVLFIMCVISILTSI